MAHKFSDEFKLNNAGHSITANDSIITGYVLHIVTTPSGVLLKEEDIKAIIEYLQSKLKDFS